MSAALRATGEEKVAIGVLCSFLSPLIERHVDKSFPRLVNLPLSNRQQILDSQRSVAPRDSLAPSRKDSQIMAEAVIAGLSKHCSPAFSLVWPLTVGRYNATLIDRPDMRLPFRASALAVLIGNTKDAWEPVKGFCRERAQATGSVPDNPFEDMLGEALDVALSSQELRQHQHRTFWSHRVEEGELIAMSRAAEASGHVKTEPISHLSWHPVYGPWVAFRALVVFPEVSLDDVLDDVERPVAPVDIHGDHTSIKLAMDHALAAPGDWKRWVSVRDTVSEMVGGGRRYSDQQIAYHYAGDRSSMLPASP